MILSVNQPVKPLEECTATWTTLSPRATQEPARQLTLFNSNTCPDMQRIGARMRLLMLPQSCFRQINVPLDVAQDFVVDDAIVAELKNSPTFHPERFVREMFVFGRKQPTPGARI